MKSTAKMSGPERRAGIIKAVRKVFVEKGFHGTTTRELAAAAGVSEALLFKHFPSKEALYRAMLLSCVKADDAGHIERLRNLKPSAASLVRMVHDLASHMLLERPPDDQEHAMIRLVLRSLTDDGEFARLAMQGMPSQWVQQAEQCLQAAIVSDDAYDRPVEPGAGAWFATHLSAMLMIHWLPAKPVVDYHVSREKLLQQVVWFILRGMGLKEEAIRRHYDPSVLATVEDIA
jgi:AcrR family transcriptional regulator